MYDHFFKTESLTWNFSFKNQEWFKSLHVYEHMAFQKDFLVEALPGNVCEFPVLYICQGLLASFSNV